MSGDDDQVQRNFVQIGEGEVECPEGCEDTGVKLHASYQKAKPDGGTAPAQRGTLGMRREYGRKAHE